MSEKLLKSRAKRIPDEIRSQRLLTSDDPINKAEPIMQNINMMLLSEVWFTFLQPFEPRTACPICLERIIQGFKQLYPHLVALESDYQMLNEI